MNDQQQHDSSRMWACTLGALGVVFGDIGTSPLYSIRECFSELHGLTVNAENVFGILSLIVWSLILVVFVKYILFVLRADNKGEGGILSLLVLALPKSKTSGGRKRWIIYIGLFGAALLYGDGIITPSITVLSAIEGLNTATPLFEPYVIPLTLLILMGIFFVQSIGTKHIGFVFGPVILIYLAMLAALGIPKIIENPEILLALNPWYAVLFFMNNGMVGFWTLGAVFLAVTGCEALYADMGHFGRRPIRRAWSFIVFPALVINYFGQGALILGDPSTVSAPFYHLAPGWALYPVVIIATLASIVASQALISGVYSLTQQAIVLGFCPRLQVVHTSDEEIGQIYIPAINWALLIACMWLVVSFKTSSDLAGAYGIAVAMTMMITTGLAMLFAHRKWRWKMSTIIIIGTLMLGVDAVFFVANIIKIPHGGWFPLLVAGFIFILMTTWKRGRRILAIRLRSQTKTIAHFLQDDVNDQIHRIKGAAVFMTSDPEMTPPAMARNLAHNKVLHELVVILSIVTRDVPRVNRESRVTIENLKNGFFRVICSFGFMETQTIQEVLEACRVHNLDININEVTFFLGRETLIAAKRHGGMALWREHLFAFMSRNAQRATQFFKIPPNQVIEIGTQIEL
jgi:KUP system potassium uptake protein